MILPQTKARRVAILQIELAQALGASKPDWIVGGWMIHQPARSHAVPDPERSGSPNPTGDIDAGLNLDFLATRSESSQRDPAVPRRFAGDR